jgi:hypothetical protein
MMAYQLIVVTYIVTMLLLDYVVMLGLSTLIAVTYSVIMLCVVRLSAIKTVIAQLLTYKTD